MANQEHLDRLKQGIIQWNEWRKTYEGEIDLRDAELSQANLRRANLRRANLGGANLVEAKLSEANLSQTDLRGANLRGATLYEAHLLWANLEGAYLSQANLHMADLCSVNLERAYLDGAYLGHATLSAANLRGADLHEAKLGSADLHEADLRGANLRRANLNGADLHNVDLRDADLHEADLRNAKLSDAKLGRVNLSQALLKDTILARNDLRATKGLLQINHQGPLVIDLPTVRLPEDGSALHFLRGAGIPDEWINFYCAQIMLPIQYHSCFISYSSKDDLLAHRLHTDLQDYGVRCWFAPEDMKIGDKIRARIDEAIHLHEKLLLLLSEHSLTSTWVEDEVEAALEKEQRQQREVLFPVRLDESVIQTSQAWAAKLRRTRHIGDFTHWMDPHAYQQAFERLLRDLKAN